jgi:hypothetical protein
VETAIPQEVTAVSSSFEKGQAYFIEKLHSCFISVFERRNAGSRDLGANKARRDK